MVVTSCQVDASMFGFMQLNRLYCVCTIKLNDTVQSRFGTMTSVEKSIDENFILFYSPNEEIK